MQVDLNQVYTIKIANGDEIVAKITENFPGYYVVVSPLTVVPGPQGIQMVRSLFTADPEAIIRINKTQVSILAASREEVCDSYTEAITGIRPVRSSKILLG
mgnify:CR=1 FL=1